MEKCNMKKLKPIILCLAAAALAGAILPVAQADNLFADGNSTTNLNNQTQANLSISCPQVLRAGNMDRCYAGVQVSENVARLVNVKWSSSDKSVVSIDDDGKVTGGNVTSSSKATITATYTGSDTPTQTATATITVAPSAILSGLIVNCPSALISGSTGNCRAGAIYSDEGRKDVAPVWSSSNTSVATVDASGKVTALSVASKTTVFITGSYTEGGVTKMAIGTISINPVGSVPDGSVPPLSSATIECFFTWAESHYPELFPTGVGKVSTVTFGPYTYRNYPIDYTYLGFDTLTNTVIYVGPFSGGTLLQLGDFSTTWAKPSGCK